MAIGLVIEQPVNIPWFKKISMPPGHVFTDKQQAIGDWPCGPGMRPKKRQERQTKNEGILNPLGNAFFLRKVLCAVERGNVEQRRDCIVNFDDDDKSDRCSHVHLLYL